jgi:hypothetical protein
MILRPQIYCLWRGFPHFPQAFHASEALYKCKFTGSEALGLIVGPSRFLHQLIRDYSPVIIHLKRDVSAVARKS